MNFYVDEYSQRYDRIKEAFKAPTKDDILQTNISDEDIRFCNEVNDVGYNLHVINLPHQENFLAVQLIKVEF